MHGRGHQDTRRGNIGQRTRHIVREERALGVHCQGGHHRQQHRQLHAIHVLRRHRGDHVRHSVGVRPQAFQRDQILARAGQETAPGLGIGLRAAGGARGETDRHQRVVGQLWNRARSLRQFGRQLPIPRRRELQVQIAQAVRIGVARLHFAHYRRCTRRWQQRYLPAQRARVERHHETVAVLAQIHCMATFRQLLRQTVHMRDEGGQIDRLPRAPGQRPVERTNSHRMGNRGAGRLDMKTVGRKSTLACPPPALLASREVPSAANRGERVLCRWLAHVCRRRARCAARQIICSPVGDTPPAWQRPGNLGTTVSPAYDQSLGQSP